jgi:hypothetical protein
MNHNEAVEQMTVERYVLSELDADAREDFEEHLFTCPDCALDSRVATMFIEEATSQLGEIACSQPAAKSTGKRDKGLAGWCLWMRPAFAVPVFAALLAVIGYQNLVTLPVLRKAANEPAVIPNAPLSGTTRGAMSTTIVAERGRGIAVPVDIPLDPGIGTFVSYSFELYNPQGKLAWSGTIPAPAQRSAGDFEISLVMPGGMLKDGSYSVSIAGIGAHGECTPIEHYAFNVSLTK